MKLKWFRTALSLLGMTLIASGLYVLLLAIATARSGLNVANYGPLFALTAAMWTAAHFLLKRATATD
jgi:hypothetical protein